MKIIKQIQMCTVAMALMVVVGTPAWAANSLTFQGVTFEWASAGNFLELNILNALSGPTSSDNWGDITHLAAFQIGIEGLTGATVDGWSSPAGELNAKGCGEGASKGKVCFETATPLELTDDLSFNIALKGVDPVSVTGLDLKVNFIDQDTFEKWDCDQPPCYKAYKAAGDLLSQTITSPAPEPEIYAMMAVGVGVVGWAARRKRRKQTV